MARRLSRRLGHAALLALVLLIASAIGANVYLNSQYLPKLVRSIQQGTTVQFRFAWTLWPGRVHLEGLKVRGDERGFIWEVSADRAYVIAELSGLARRRIEMDTLELSGVSVKVRPRLRYLDASDDYLRSLPELPTDLPALLTEGPELSPELRRDRNPWSVSIREARVDGLENLWVDRFRFTGRAVAEGSLTITSGRVLETGPTKVTVHRGEISIEGKPVLAELEGGGTTSLGPVDLSSASGFALLGTLSGDTKLSAKVMGLDFFPRLPGLPVQIEFENARGAITTEVALKDGAVQPGAVLDWSAPDAAANLAGFNARGALTLHATVEQDPGGELRTRAIASLVDFQLSRPGAPPLSSGKKVVLQLDAPNVVLARANQFDQDLHDALVKWPGRLMLEQVRLLGEERQLQWEAELGSLDAAIDLSALERREILLTTASGQQAKVRIRPRLLPSDATPAVLKSLPPIQGLRSPVKQGPAPFVSLAERAAESPWGIRVLDSKITGVEQLWLESYRFDGHLDVNGGFTWEPGGRVSGGPFRFEVNDGSLRIAQWRAATGIKGTITAEIAPFDLDEPEGPAAFRTWSATSDLQALIDQVDFVRHFPTIPIPAQLVGGQGPILAKLQMNQGVLQAGSRVHWETSSLQASTNGFRFVGPFSFDAEWTDKSGEPRLNVEGRVSPYRVTRVGQEKALVSGRLITFRMEAPKFDLARPSFEPMSYAQVHDGRVPDLRAINEFIPPNLPLKVEAGGGTFTGKVSFTHKGQAWAEFKIGGIGAQLVYDKVYVQGDWSCEAKLSNLDLKTGAGDVTHATLQLDNMSLREGSHARDGWFGRVDLTHGKVRPGEAMLLSGDVETTMRDGRPLIAFFAAETDLFPTWARPLVTLQALHGTGRFRLGTDRLEIDGLNARGQSLELRGRLRKQGMKQMGDMLVIARGQEVGVALRGSRVELKLIGAAAWYREQMMNPRW